MRNKIIILALCLLCLTSATNYNAVKSDDAILYAIFKNRFKEPIEVMYFMMHDARILKATSYDENKISLRMWALESSFRTRS